MAISLGPVCCLGEEAKPLLITTSLHNETFRLESDNPPLRDRLPGLHIREEMLCNLIFPQSMTFTCLYSQTPSDCFFIARTSTHKTPSRTLIIIYLPFRSAKHQR